MVMQRDRKLTVIEKLSDAYIILSKARCAADRTTGGSWFDSKQV
jgi:hypothetical protein